MILWLDQALGWGEIIWLEGEVLEAVRKLKGWTWLEESSKVARSDMEEAPLRRRNGA